MWRYDAKMIDLRPFDMINIEVLTFQIFLLHSTQTEAICDFSCELNVFSLAFREKPPTQTCKFVIDSCNYETKIVFLFW